MAQQVAAPTTAGPILQAQVEGCGSLGGGPTVDLDQQRRQGALRRNKVLQATAAGGPSTLLAGRYPGGGALAARETQQRFVGCALLPTPCRARIGWQCWQQLLAEPGRLLALLLGR